MSLPTFRRRILTSMLLVVAVFSGLGLLMILALTAAGSIPPALVHLNYDSIEAADKMREAWTALRFPEAFPDLPNSLAVAQFDAALAFELSNVTEAGEREVADKIKGLWTQHRQLPHVAPVDDFNVMQRYLKKVIAVNEQGMFGRVASAKNLSILALVSAIAVLIVTVIVATYLADSFATKLANPIKGLAEALHARPGLDRALKLPPPTNIELRILTREVRRLWDSLVENNQYNIGQIVQEKGRLETVLASVEDAFIVLDGQGKVSHCNALMEAILGLAKSQIIAAAWLDLPTARPAYMELRQCFSRPGDQETELEILVGERLYNFALRSREILGQGAERVGRLMLLRDMTEKRQRERLKAQLIDLLSHELKTPIQSLGMAAEMLERRKTEMPSDLRFFVETINEDVQRIRAVAQQFLQASQTQTKTMRIDLQRVPLSDALRAWLKPFEVIADAKGISLNYQLAHQQTIWAKIDPIKFPWAISNLLSNAIRVSPKGGVVEILLAEQGAVTSIEVGDTGPGVPEAVRRRMYEPFYQGPVGLGEDVERGLLGVGLTIAKEVVEAHEGHLLYRSREPHGSIFCIELPTPSPMDG